MVGLGEDFDEIVSVFDDLRRVGVSILTIGQYLRPTPKHAPMARYYHPAEFADLKKIAMARGFSTSSPAHSCAARITRTNRPTQCSHRASSRGFSLQWRELSACDAL